MASEARKGSALAASAVRGVTDGGDVDVEREMTATRQTLLAADDTHEQVALDDEPPPAADDLAAATVGADAANAAAGIYRPLTSVFSAPRRVSMSHLLVESVSQVLAAPRVIITSAGCIFLFRGLAYVVTVATSTAAQPTSPLQYVASGVSAALTLFFGALITLQSLALGTRKRVHGMRLARTAFFSLPFALLALIVLSIIGSLWALLFYVVGLAQSSALLGILGTAVVLFYLILLPEIVALMPNAVLASLRVGFVKSTVGR